MSHKIVSVCVLAASLGLSGCFGQGPKESGSQLIGGIGGALIGSQFGGGEGRLVGVAIGALAGSYLGGALGRSMDEKDKALSQETLNRSLETAPDRKISRWRNPNNQHQGTVRVIRTNEYRTKVCRDYIHTVIIDGQTEKVHGRACRDMRDVKGEWQVQS